MSALIWIVQIRAGTFIGYACRYLFSFQIVRFRAKSSNLALYLPLSHREVNQRFCPRHRS